MNTQRASDSPARNLIGWCAVAFGVITTAFWTYWGINEAFHEGWWHSTLSQNLLWTLAYLVPGLALMSVSLLALRFPLAGAVCWLALLAYAVHRFGWLRHGFRLDLVILCSLFLAAAALFCFGQPEPRKWAYRVTWIIPLFIILAWGVEPAWRVPRRYDDGKRSARLIEGNGVRLIWAPSGPGWPDHGGNFQEAQNACRHLSADGSALLPTAQEIWRLPTIDEAVRSSVRHGANAGGAFNPRTDRASYAIEPDKESPLWNPKSEVIYWWTATQPSSDRAYRLTYNGRVNAILARTHIGTLAYRCVKAE